MPDLSISEAGSVQFPMVAHAAEIGWVPVSPDEARARRGGVAGMLFVDEVAAALTRFNPWMTADAVRQVVEKLQAIPPTIEGNREVLAWLRGERQWHDEAESRHRRVTLVDFSPGGDNRLHVTWEWRLTPPARKGNRADVVFLVNGIPVCIVEHKNPADGRAIERAITQLRRYELETPELLGTPQLFNVTHLLEYWYGVTWNANRRFITRWKERPEESYRFAVQAFFEPTDFLRTLQHWILFYVEDGETRKTVLRQHQRGAIDLIVARCADSAKSRGLVWHTQGSGKTFTLLTAARQILEAKDRFANATVILVVDRKELEGQLSGWVTRLIVELENLEIPVWKAGSRAELRELLATDRRGLILSMIHKFDGLDRDASTRDNVFVFIDEAHRSVARELGTYLMAALPNATIIGFTGTPIDRTAQGEGTFKIFGAQDDAGYLDKYSIRESIEDGTTLPIRHVMAPSEMTVPTDQLDQEFFALAESEGVTDIEELDRVLDRAVGIQTFLAADDRIEKVAAFVADHFRKNVAPLGYKAFLVAVNREACAKYKRALDQHLPPEWSEAVYTESAADAIDRPLVAELQLSAEREDDVRKLFKKPGHNPMILIVTDKLLTGYDAPLLYCMYLDKPMRNHVLLQAIARVNRPYVDADGVEKKIGLVVDFVGVLRELRKALQFDSEDVDGVIEGLDSLMADFLAKIVAAREMFLEQVEAGTPDEQLERAVYGRFVDPDARREFFDAWNELEALWEILSPSAELRDHIDTYKRLARLYATVRNAYAQSTGFVADLAHKTKALVQDEVSVEGLGAVIRSVTFDPETLERLRKEPGSDEGKVYNLVRGLHKEIHEDSEVAPLLRSISERAQQVIKDLESRNVSGLAALDQLELLAEEARDIAQIRAETGLTPRAFAVYWSLKDDSALSAAGIDALSLARKVEELMARYPHADVNQEEERRLRAALYHPLIALDQSARGAIVYRILVSLFDADSNQDD